MIRYKFSKQDNKDFATTLKTRVNNYFQENEICRHANPQMVTKTTLALSIYLLPYLLIVLGGITYIPLLFLLWIIMGFGKAFIGTSVMHDALHGSYSQKKAVNYFMGISAFLIGADPTNWKIQHNVLHHTYTNIEHTDEDIAPRYVMRFTPNQPRRWFHSYQYIYAFFFYGISTLMWTTFKDFAKIIQYKKNGLVKKGSKFNRHLSMMVIRKLLYHVIFLVIPILVLPFSVWMVLLMYLTMHIVTGLFLSVVFQTAHIMPDLNFIEQEDEHIEHNWLVHQVRTTSNFAMNNKLLSWFIGGLNYQIEHHLFPNICHVHYPEISKIVRQTTAEFNLPYHYQKTFWAAIVSHVRMLKTLGRHDALQPAIAK